MASLTYDEISSDKCKQLIRDCDSFEITGLSGRMGSAVTLMENAIESQGYTCRIYSVGRVAAAGGSFFGGITGVLGVASAIGMAAHNLVTFNPDYEIAKHLVDNKLSVTYKK